MEHGSALVPLRPSILLLLSLSSSILAWGSVPTMQQVEPLGSLPVFTSESSTYGVFSLDSTERRIRIERDTNITDEIDIGLTIPPDTVTTPCGEGDHCVDYGGLARLLVNVEGNCHHVEWIVEDDQLEELKDCVHLNGHWYGGGEQFTQPWPIEKKARLETAYVTADMLQNPSWYGGVSERYWLSSTGLVVHVSDSTPLFLSLPDDNSDGRADTLCMSAKFKAPFQTTEGVPLRLEYSVCTGEDVRQVHESTFPMYYGRPVSTPDSGMMSAPIWCTWAQYKKKIDQEKVLELAQRVVDEGHTYNQLEIDDEWETCYGEAVFNETKFPDAKQMVQQLHELGYKVTLWIHPFINSDCSAFVTADQNGYFVKDSSGGTQLTSWWDGDSAGIIDFTNQDAVAWWTGRLTDLKSLTGIDSFKFDAGETSWLPDSYSLDADKTLWPNIYSTKYVDAASSFGNLIEVRAAQKSQTHPIFFRMLDINSNWSYQNGLAKLIPTLLHFGILGYPFVLPDMIGGNAYNGLPSEELFIRWTQANALMPAMQYSLLPWEIGVTANEVALAMNELHNEYAPIILQAANKSTITTSPINKPTWWLCPKEEICLNADQQFLLGEHTLVAPVTEEGATEKTVVIPPGEWRSQTDDRVYSGPSEIVITNITIRSLPIFTKVSEY